MCIKAAEDTLDNTCPITGMHITREAERVGYTYRPLFKDLKLGFTKQADQLPLVQFKVEQLQPCLNENEHSIHHDI